LSRIPIGNIIDNGILRNHCFHRSKDGVTVDVVVASFLVVVEEEDDDMFFFGSTGKVNDNV
jgi:hypothetical protein